MENNSGQTLAASPSQQTEGLKSLKDLVRLLVVGCNERVKNYHISKISEPIDLKEDLIAFVSIFDELFLNTYEPLQNKVYKKGDKFKKMKNKAGQDIQVTDLCDKIAAWIDMDYKELPNLNVIFEDGVGLYTYYVKFLTEAEIYEV
jgi:hypothetical protein